MAARAMVISARAGDDVRAHTRPRKEGRSPSWAMAMDVRDNPARIAASEPRLAKDATATTMSRQESGAMSATGVALAARPSTPTLPSNVNASNA